jgi:hypothetical protein
MGTVMFGDGGQSSNENNAAVCSLECRIFGVNETFAVADMAAANFRNSLDQESCH